MKDLYSFIKSAACIRYRPKDGKPRSTIKNLKQYKIVKKASSIRSSETAIKLLRRFVK